MRTAADPEADGLHRQALDRSVALLLHCDRGGLSLGSAVCIRVGSRFLLATAGHNLAGLAHDRQIRLLPRGRYRADPVRCLARSRHDGGAGRRPDVGWLEMPPAAVRRSGLDSHGVDELAPRPAPERPVLVHGFPAHGVDPRNLGGTRFSLAGTALSVAAVRPAIAVVGYRPDQDLVVSWPAGRHPAGLSGGGVWGGDPAGGLRLIALIRSWNARRRLLFCTPIDWWLRRVHDDLPDLRSDLPIRPELD